MLDYTELESMIETAMREAIVPGLAIGVIQDGALVYAKGFGVTSTDETAMPITPDTLFRIGSVTKPLTGTMIMRLAEDGFLDLDMPISEYVSGLKVGEPDIASQITMRMLLSHTTGLPTGLAYSGWREETGLKTFANTVIPNLKPVVPPNTVYYYSNAGINLAGYIAEAVTSKSYSSLMQELVFEPLEMYRTGFDPLIAMTYPLSQSFVLDFESKPVIKRPFIDNCGEYPSGFAISTVRDMAHFAIMHMSEGQFSDKQILQGDNVLEMHRPHANLYTFDKRGYGLTFRSRYYDEGVRVVWHNGAIAKYGAALAMIPDRGIAVVVVLNRAVNAWTWVDRIVSFVFDTLVPLTEVESAHSPYLTDTTPDWYKRAYLSSSMGLAEITVEDGYLTLVLNRAKGTLQYSPLFGQYVGGKFGSNGTLSVHFHVEEGQVTYLIIDGVLFKPFDYDPTFSPEMTVWENIYGGVYRGDVDVFTTRFKNGNMLLYSDDERAAGICIPLDETSFACEFGTFKFEIDSDGRARALISIRDEWRFDRVENAP